MYIIINVKKNGENNQKEPEKTEDYIMYENVTYIAEKIENTFKKDGANYIAELGELNEGKDYDKTDRDNLTIYIPKSALEKKNEYNHIILYIHGGGWILNNKEENHYLWIMSVGQGYISATVGYTLLTEEYKSYGINVYRILDEITASIKTLKYILEFLALIHRN